MMRSMTRSNTLTPCTPRRLARVLCAGWLALVLATGCGGVPWDEAGDQTGVEPCGASPAEGSDLLSEGGASICSGAGQASSALQLPPPDDDPVPVIAPFGHPLTPLGTNPDPAIRADLKSSTKTVTLDDPVPILPTATTPTGK